MSTTNGNVDLLGRIRAKKPESKPFTVEGWGETVELRSMTIAEKVGLFGDGDDVKEQMADLLPNVIVLTCYDPTTDEALFSEDDLEWLSNQPANVVEELALAGLAASGVSDDALDSAKQD